MSHHHTAAQDTAQRMEFDRAVLRHRPELYGAAMRMTGSEAEAEDLVQEAVLRAWTFWDRFQRGTNGRAWMHRILVNTFINGYRRRRREREILGEIELSKKVESPESFRGSIPGERFGDEVREALESLQPEFRDVLLHVDLRGRSYRDTARQMGCPIGTVMSRLHRARRAMQQRLSGYASSEGYIREAA